MRHKLILVYCWFCLLLAIAAGVWVCYDLNRIGKLPHRLNDLEQHLDNIEKTMKNL